MMHRNGGNPDQFPGQWDGQAQQQHRFHTQQHQQQQHQQLPQQQQQQQQSQMNAYRMQQQMIMMHQQQQGQQVQRRGGDQFSMAAANAMAIGGMGFVPGSQMLGQPGNVDISNSTVMQSAMMMNQGQAMNQQGMANSMGQGSSNAAGVGVGVGGMSVSGAGGMMGPNRMPSNAAMFLRMQQQFQQQAGGGGGTPQPQLPVSTGGLRNPTMMGGNVNVGGGATPNAGGAGFNSQAQAALYLSALQAQGMGNQQQSGQQGQANPKPQPVAGPAGMPIAPIASGVGSSQLQQQVGGMAEFQRAASHGLPSNQEQPPPQNKDVGQRQESQTQVLLQQQCLIARLQQQLQQQQQPGNNAGMLPSQLPSGQQQQQWNRGTPGVGGAGQQNMSTSNNLMQQLQMGNFPLRSTSAGGVGPQISSQSSLYNMNQRQPSPNTQIRRTSLGVGMNAQQHQQLQLQAHQLPNMFGDDNKLQEGQPSQQTNRYHELLGKNSQQSTNQASIILSALKPSLPEPINVPQSQGRAGLTQPSLVDPPTSLTTPTALGGIWGQNIPPAMRNQIPNQQVIMNANTQHPSLASTNTVEQAHARAQTRNAQKAQDPKQQQQLLTAHMLQKQLNERGNTPSLNAARSASGSPPELGGGDRDCSAPGIMLDQRLKQLQAMQHPRQMQDQLKLVGAGWGGDSSVGDPQQQWQFQAQLSQAQQLQYQQRQSEVLSMGVGGGILTQGGNQQATGNESTNNSAKGNLNAFTNDPSSTSWNNSINSVSSLRESQRSHSQGSLFSQTSFNLVDPDPIADGFNTALGDTVRASSATGDKVSSGDGQQSFLDGRFAGGWQSNADLPDRRRINFHIIKVIERIRPDANRMSQNRLPLMAKKLEEHLYRSAKTKEEYVDPATLKFRLHLIAKGGGILKPGDEEYGVEVQSDHSSSNVTSRTSSIAHSGAGKVGSNTHYSVPSSRSNIQQAVPTENLSRGPENSSEPMVGGVGLPLNNMLLQQMSNQAARSSILETKASSVSGTQVSMTPRQGMTEKLVIQQQLRLLLLRHTSKCTSGPSCRTQYCSQMVSVWKHIKKCRDNSCKISHCLSSRCVLNHYRKCKREGSIASCAICGPVMKHARQSGEGSEFRNGTVGWGQDDMGTDEFDAFAFSDESPELPDSLDDIIIFSEDAKIDVVVDDLYDSVMTQLRNIEPLDAFPTRELNTMPKSIGSDKPIPQDIGNLPLALNPRRNVEITQQYAGQSEIPGNLLAHTQTQLKNDSGCSMLELQKVLELKQLLSQLIQQQKANLFGQNRKLQQKLTLASNMQQAQQLQKEQAICEQLHEQYDQQQLILHGDIQRIISLLQQERDQQGVLAPSSEQATACAEDNVSLKRSADQMTNGVEPLHKKPAGVEYCLSIKEREEDAETDLLSVESDAASSNLSDAVPSKSASSLIPFMSVSDIEYHLDSLVSIGQLTPRHISRKCLPLVKKLINHEYGWVFKDAVDPVELGIPDYFDIIKNPMDLTLVANKLEDGAYKDLASFERDSKLVFENAIQFNGDDSAVGVMALELLDIFDADLKNAMKGSKIDKDSQKKRGNACGLCGNHRRVFDPPDLICSGSCGMQKIRRNAPYYTDSFKQNHWCEHCYNNRLKDDELIQLDDGRVTTKSLLVELRNDFTPEEAWVQCDRCHDWNHQICALFNGLQNAKCSAYTCPKCCIKDAGEDGKQARTGSKGASELPHCNLSRSIENGLLTMLSEVYEKVAKDRSCTVAQVEKAEGLNVRVVSSLKKTQKVREAMRARYSAKGYPTEFKVTTKCIVLFQKIHGVDVLLFGMYVYEYGDDCAEPNRRRVYISYLDSVRYLEPASYRTIVYQSVIIEYLRFVKMRGFHTAHIWSCPPAKGDEYIFHCHPTHQLTPNDDLLCAWYIEMLAKAKEAGIVLKTRTLYDEYFKNYAVNPKTGRMYDPTSLPYFDGDYIPGEIEKIIKDLNQDDLKREDTKLKGPKPTTTNTQKEGKRVGTRSNPGVLVDQSRDRVMNRLDLVMSRMKKNFMVVQLLSDDFIDAVKKGVDLSSWVEGVEQKGKSGNVPTSDYPATGGAILKVAADTTDHDPSMEQDCIDTRLQFLNYCQRNNYQFDELRRAKHSSMMLLATLHKPRAEQDQQVRAYLQLVFHASTCSGSPVCSSSNCQRMQQLFKHVQDCDVTYKRGCKVCTRLFMLLTRHARDCATEGCPVPYCELIKTRTRLLVRQQQMMDDRRRDAQNDRIVQEEGGAPDCD